MMTKPTKRVRCAVYTRVSTEYGLDQEFNSLDAQHEAAEAYVHSQAHDGWTLIRTRYDDGGYSGPRHHRCQLQCSARGDRSDPAFHHAADAGSPIPGHAGTSCGAGAPTRRDRGS
jgi:Resolvase, N terminal domain